MLTQDIYELLEDEFLDAIEKKDRDSARHFLMLFLQQVELKKEAEEKSDRIMVELVNLRADMKAMLEVMNARFEAVDKRFEAVDKRFEDMNKRFEDVNKRFEDVNKRFEDMNKRFEDMNKKFTMIMWFIGLVSAISTAVIKLL